MWCLQFPIGFLKEWWELEDIYKESFLVFTTLLHQSFAVISFIPNLTAIYIVLKITLMSLSVQFSRSVMSDSLRPHGLQHARPPCQSPTPGVYPNLCPLSRWCHPAISSSVVPFSFCPQSLPASGSFPRVNLHICNKSHSYEATYVTVTVSKLGQIVLI